MNQDQDETNGEPEDAYQLTFHVARDGLIVDVTGLADQAGGTIHCALQLWEVMGDRDAVPGVETSGNLPDYLISRANAAAKVSSQRRGRGALALCRQGRPLPVPARQRRPGDFGAGSAREGPARERDAAASVSGGVGRQRARIRHRTGHGDDRQSRQRSLVDASLHGERLGLESTPSPAGRWTAGGRTTAVGAAAASSDLGAVRRSRGQRAGHRRAVQSGDRGPAVRHPERFLESKPVCAVHRCEIAPAAPGQGRAGQHAAGRIRRDPTCDRGSGGTIARTTRPCSTPSVTRSKRGSGAKPSRASFTSTTRPA